MRQLILVASRGEAKIFEKINAQPLRWIKTLNNKNGRRRESEFHFDLPGQSYSKFKGNSGPHNLEGKNSHITTVALKFASTIAKILEDSYHHKDYDKAVIFASPKLLGAIKEETLKLTKHVPIKFISKNIEKASTQEILDHI